VKVVKNKVAPPFRKAEMEIMFGKGISASGSLLDAALRFDVIQKTGSWYSYGEERIGQGRDNAKVFLETNADISAAVEHRVRELLFTPKPAPGDAPPADETKVAAEGEPASGEEAAESAQEPPSDDGVVAEPSPPGGSSTARRKATQQAEARASEEELF